ncbi:MAG: helix-turn-helix domain-containing protein [Clostridia bacterium]|nr:helix-turn-helix domain-containing protein [Clostridia bacterium]
MITAVEPKVEAAGRYSVAQASEALGIHRNTLRNYTEQGLIKCGFRRQTARKFYLGSEILKFWRAQL